MSNFFSNNNNQTNLFSQNNDIETQDFFAEFNTDNVSSDEKKKDNSLGSQYKELETNYEQIFIEAAESIRKELDNIKPQNACNNCSNKDCQIQKKDIFAPYPPTGCKLREWQMQSITYLAGDYQVKLKAAYKEIMQKKDKIQCGRCASCCKLAVSEYSYTQLKQRAMRGDKFSEDFISVFIPYDSEEEAKAANPEYFDLLNKLVVEDRIFYYYCPKLEGNSCTIYENRPNVCRNFPHNPLKLLPSSCTYNEWKNEITHQAMLLKAKTDIIAYYREKLG